MVKKTLQEEALQTTVSVLEDIFYLQNPAILTKQEFFNSHRRLHSLTFDRRKQSLFDLRVTPISELHRIRSQRGRKFDAHYATDTPLVLSVCHSNLVAIIKLGIVRHGQIITVVSKAIALIDRFLE